MTASLSLDQLLKLVSRSFYLSLRVLPSDIRSAMGVGYLLCRAADSIADTEVIPPEERLRILSEVKKTFAIFPMNPDRGQSLAEKTRSHLTPGLSSEKLLLERYADAITAFLALTKTDQALVQRVVVGVVDGMEMDLKTFGTGADKDRVVALKTNGELERYLELIGGEPGRFWTDLCAAHRPKLRSTLEGLRSDGIRFGTGLQLVNILRDFPADLKKGRCYIPLERLDASNVTLEKLATGESNDQFLTIYHELIDSAVDRMKAGLSYVESLPRHMVRMRAAVWWPLIIGLRTLGLLREDRDVLASTMPVKVQRREVYWLLLTSAFTMPFDRLLKADFNDMAEAALSSGGVTPPR